MTENKTVRQVADDYRDLELGKLDESLRSMYVNSNAKYRNIIENIFNETVLEYAESDRPSPPYAHGTLDAPFWQGGKPAYAKPLELYNAVLSNDYSTIEVEGSVRGGKDIYSLLAWARFLQVTPDPTHLALGSSLEHVLRTVLMSSGFGLFFLIPHGVFVRESISGAQRGVYKFVDNYGRQKEILFYGNEKENDSNKFQGFTIGSCYVNETLNHHVKGLNQAKFRMTSALQPLMLMTQNPSGRSAMFYQDFERPKLATLRDIEQMEMIRDKYGDKFRQLERKINEDRDKKRVELVEEYLLQKGVGKAKELSTREQIYLNEKALFVNFEFRKIIRDLKVQQFCEDLTEDDYCFNKSMSKIVNFKRGGVNPNGIFNAYDFYYTHFTIDDNLAMTDMQRQDFKNQYAPGTSAYDQYILGIRRSTDSAVYNMFTDKNIFKGDIQHFNYQQTERIIAIDKGLNHPNGMIDCEVDFEKGIVWQLQESLLDFKGTNIVNRGLESIYLELLRLIRARRNREMPAMVIVDPSAIELVKYLKDRGIPVREANNRVWNVKGYEKQEAHQYQDKDLIGIPFVQTAIAKLKYRVHESCIYTIEQIGSYEAPFDEKTGKEKVKKVNDDLVDPIRYVFNTLIRIGMWKGGKEDGEEEIDDGSRVSGDEVTEDGQRDLVREVIRIFDGDDAGFQTDASDFWGGGSGFFGE